jgi:hypothetical protein
MNTLTPISQALASQGRYGDSTLVHMNPQEVSGLQALARRHGTSMTVNPQTGLPEAFNLKSLLPMVAGLALGPAGIGLTALQAGMLTGAATGLITKDPMQGLMAGLGGYGGAGLGAGFGAAGAATPGAATMGATPIDPTTFSGINPSVAYDPATMGFGAVTPGAAPITGASPAFYGDLSQLTPGEMGAFTSPPPSTLGQNLSQAGRGFTSMLGSGPEGTAARSAFMGTPGVAGNAAKGIAETAATGVGGLSGLAKYGSAAAAPMMMAQDESLQSRPSYIRGYDLDIDNLSGMSDPLASSSEQELLRYRFAPREPVRVAQGGPIRYQEGGDVSSSGMSLDPYTGASLTPGEADVFRNISNIERMAGLPITGLPGGKPYIGPGDMDRFQKAVYAGDYKGAGQMAQQAGFSPFETSKYINENLAGLNLSSPVTPQTVSSFFTPNNPLNRQAMPSASTTSFELPPQPTQMTKQDQTSKSDIQSLFPKYDVTRVDNLNKPVAQTAKFFKSFGSSNLQEFTPTGDIDMSNYFYDPKLGGFKQKPAPEFSASAGGLTTIKGFKRFQEGGLASIMSPVEADTPQMNGRFLRGNGDGMSDEIPATIEGEQDALLSDGEFVIPADIVSHLGNGSSEAGAKILYEMMDRVRKARTGQKEQAEEISVEKFLPA